MSRRLVMIEWHDSRRPINDWGFIEDFDGFSPVVVRSVGWLICDRDDVKAIAPNIGDCGDTREQAIGIMQIPTRCIVSITDLDHTGSGG